MTCPSRFDVGQDQVLACIEHLRGNPFRPGATHSAMAYGVRWTWTDREQDRPQSINEGSGAPTGEQRA